MKFKFIKIINILLVLVIVVLLSFTFKENINSDENNDITKLEFVNDSVRIRMDSNITLGIKLSPKNVEEADLTFTSKNEEVATVNESGVVTPKKTGKTTITVKSKDGKLKDTCEVTVLKEYLFFLGDSNWELIEGKRKGGDTKEPYEINYREYTKDKNLFFLSKSGAGLKWMSGEVSIDMEEHGYAMVGSGDNASEEMKEIISEHDEAYFKIIIQMGTNDIKKAGSKEEIISYAKSYAEFYNELASSKELNENDIYVYSIIPIGKKDSCEVYTEDDFKDDEHRNTKVELFNKTIEEELNDNVTFVDIYSYFNFLAKKEKICFTPDGHWNKELTQKVYDKVLETQNEL